MAGKLSSMLRPFFLEIVTELMPFIFIQTALMDVNVSEATKLYYSMMHIDIFTLIQGMAFVSSTHVRWTHPKGDLGKMSHCCFLWLGVRQCNMYEAPLVPNRPLFYALCPLCLAGEYSFFAGESSFFTGESSFFVTSSYLLRCGIFAFKTSFNFIL